jgi:RNA polymerase subunit RPABC4/transcription elongation factor Spt4
MFIVLAFLLSIAALLAVAYPILKGHTSEAVVTSDQETLEELLAQRDAAFQALRELSFDHQVGKITDEDFVTFEANLKQVAAGRLRNLDEWEAMTDRELGPTLEREIAARMEALRSPGSSSRSPDGILGEGGGRACPACGRLALAEDKFCAACGTALPVPAIPEPAVTPQLACSNCGRPFEPGDRFCAGCGQPLPAAATALSG